MIERANKRKTPLTAHSFFCSSKRALFIDGSKNGCVYVVLLLKRFKIHVIDMTHSKLYFQLSRVNFKKIFFFSVGGHANGLKDGIFLLLLFC